MKMCVPRMLGASAGQCRCQQGFAGRRCDRCAFGFRDFPLCARCECNPAGSANGDPCDDCLCKVGPQAGSAPHPSAALLANLHGSQLFLRPT